MFFVESAEAFANTFTGWKPTIFISVGLFELLNKKEVEAVILHELYHIKQQGSFLKFSLNLLRLTSPLVAFSVCKNEFLSIEKMADLYAIKVQGTDKHLKSARKKISNYKRLTQV